MPIIKPIQSVQPVIHPTAWLAANATLVGSIEIGADSSVWYQAIIRGDVNHIHIGQGVNIQDAAIVHGSTGGPDTVIGDYVSVGHRAIIHGCVIKPHALIGMGAIVLDDVVVESESLVAAGAVVVGGTRVESGYIYAGTPARKIKALSPLAIDRMIRETAQGYIQLKEAHRSAAD